MRRLFLLLISCLGVLALCLHLWSESEAHRLAPKIQKLERLTAQHRTLLDQLQEENLPVNHPRRILMLEKLDGLCIETKDAAADMDLEAHNAKWLEPFIRP